jgi:hypothetical protein
LSSTEIDALRRDLLRVSIAVSGALAPFSPTGAPLRVVTSVEPDQPVPDSVVIEVRKPVS